MAGRASKAGLMQSCILLLRYSCATASCPRLTCSRDADAMMLDPIFSTCRAGQWQGTGIRAVGFGHMG